MVFSINPTAEKSHEMFKQLAVQQNGTAAANSSTVQSSTTTATDSASTTLPASTTDVQLAVSTTSANSPAATSGSGLAQGSGTGSDGGACSCTCLCGPGAFPAGAGVGNWGGYGGEIPSLAIRGDSYRTILTDIDRCHAGPLGNGANAFSFSSSCFGYSLPIDRILR